MTGSSVYVASVACTDGRHHLCDLEGFNMHLHQFQAGTCTCDCHNPKATP